MDRYQKEELILPAVAMRTTGAVEWKRAARTIFPLCISLLFLVTSLFATVSAASNLSIEQRERISEIDRELEQLRNGKREGTRPISAEIKGIRHYVTEDYARVVFDLTRIPEHNIDGDLVKGDVFRVIFKNTGIKIAPPGCEIEPEKGLLKCVNVREVGAGVYVNVFSNHRAKLEVFSLRGPPRLVVDLFRTSGGKKPLGREKFTGIAKFRPEERKTIVVIDPGHGGKDPGAIGPKGLKEKDVVLDISRKLKAYFEKDGRFKVHLTRSKDVYLSLEKRTAIANGTGADLFISIHTNASRKRRARGISSFVLGRKATDREALELAMRENGVMKDEDSKVKYILRDLLNNDKENGSLRLAKVINDNIVDRVRAKRRGVVDLGVKRAPFFVLFGAAMPAVLVESSFITNTYEEKLLRQSWYRDLIARSIFTGITNYIDRSKTAFYGSSGQ